MEDVEAPLATRASVFLAVSHLLFQQENLLLQTGDTLERVRVARGQGAGRGCGDDGR